MHLINRISYRSLRSHDAETGIQSKTRLYIVCTPLTNVEPVNVIGSTMIISKIQKKIATLINVIKTTIYPELNLIIRSSNDRYRMFMNGTLVNTYRIFNRTPNHREARLI